MEYNKTIKASYQIHSKNLLLEFENLIKEKLDSNNLDCNVTIYCEHRKVAKASLDEIFDIKEIDENFEKISSIVMDISDKDSKNRILIMIFYNETFNELQCSISSSKENFTLGLYDILENFIQNKFVKPLNISDNEDADNSNSNTKTINKITTIKIKTSLEKKLTSLSLSMDDLREFESLMLQDLENIKEYTIKITPTDNYLKRKQNVDGYHYNSIQDLSNNERLLGEINNYIINFNLVSTGIYIDMRLSNEFWSSSYIKAYGSNQTLYYGKFSLLEKFLNTKRTWYFPIYLDIFCIVYPSILAMFSLALLMTFLNGLFKHTISLKALSLLLIIILFNLVVFRILPKIKFNLKKTSAWYENQNFQFFLMIILTIIGILVTAFK